MRTCTLTGWCLQAPNLHSFTALTHLDLSYNHLTGLTELQCLAHGHLQELYASSNKITSTKACPFVCQSPCQSMEEPAASHAGCAKHAGAVMCQVHVQGLSSLQSLTLLELGCNRLRDTLEIQELSSLQELWLGSNRIFVSPPFCRQVLVTSHPL